MFTLDEVKEFLNDLGLATNDENIKWAYKTLIDEMKAFVKVRKFEKKYNESIFDADDCCCDDCDCDSSCKCEK